MWTQAQQLSRGHATTLFELRHREKTGEEGSRITGAAKSKVSAAELAGEEMLDDAREEMLGDPGAGPLSSRPPDVVSYGPFSPLSHPPPNRAPVACTRGEIELRMSFFCSLGFVIC